jgi:NADH-quinone oxidoreductase subunit M
MGGCVGSLLLQGIVPMLMAEWPLLSLMVFLPLLGALCLLCVRGQPEIIASNAKALALWASLVTFALSLWLYYQFDPSLAGFQWVETAVWLPDLGIAYKVGVDGISLVFVLLSTLLMPLCILASWHVTHRVREYMIAFLVLETMMLGMFCALDGVLFYIFFEAVLIPMFLIIGIWGGERRVYAAFKFFLYTFIGSVLMLLAIMAIYFTVGTSDIPTWMQSSFPLTLQKWLWLAFFASFAVKVPMWPVHTWLPAAHVEAPTAGSVILAGVLLKMGGYGFLRFSLPMFPDASQFFAPWVFCLSVVAIIYASLVALAQKDMKKLIAYSSVAHMGYVTLGIFSGNFQGLDGAMFQMLSHGVVSGALFLCVGVVYDRLHTREIARYGGIARIMPKYATVFMVMMLASVGLPGTSGFIGEFLVILSAFKVNSWLGVFVASGVILGAAYMLHLYREMMFGKLDKPDLLKLSDLSWREKVIFLPLIALVLWMGIAPDYVANLYRPALERLIKTPSSAGIDTNLGEAVPFPKTLSGGQDPLLEGGNKGSAAINGLEEGHIATLEHEFGGNYSSLSTSNFRFVSVSQKLPTISAPYP